DRRHRAEAAQARTVADGAGNGLAAAAGGGEFLALLARARRDVVDEAGLRVARMRTFEVLRHRDDTLADRLRAGGRAGADEPHGALADEGLRDRVGFLHRHVALQRLDLREVVGGFFHVLFRHAARDRDHNWRARSKTAAVLEFLELTDDVVRRQAGDAG